MTKLEVYSESFKVKYEKFIIACDAYEEESVWNKALCGEMDEFYSHSIIAVIIKLVASDGVFTEAEAHYVNDIFGLNYKPAELRDIYKANKAEINKEFDSGIQKGLDMLESINVKLAQAYKELLVLIAEIIMESDSIKDDDELKIIKKLRALD